MKENSLRQIDNDMRAFMRSSALIAFAELDLGSLLMEKPNGISAEDLSKEAKCDLRGLQALLNALAGMGYLQKVASLPPLYKISPGYEKLLNGDSPESYIPIIRHMGSLQRSWANLARSVRDGLPEEGKAGILSPEEEKKAFIMGMNSVGQTLAVETIDKLIASKALKDLAPAPAILDVGGASGTYSQVFMERFPESSITIFDLPVGIAQAKKRFGDNKRVTYQEGDFDKEKLPGGQDLAWVSAIIHQMNREESQKLYKKIWDTLKPGGMIGVRDYVMADNGYEPLEGAFFGLNMLTRTKTGRVYTKAEIEEDLRVAGFEGIDKAVDAPGMGSVVTAKKPK